MRFHARDATFFTAEKPSFGPGAGGFCAENGKGGSKRALRCFEMRYRLRDPRFLRAEKRALGCKWGIFGREMEAIRARFRAERI